MVRTSLRELLKGGVRGGYAPGEGNIYSWEPYASLQGLSEGEPKGRGFEQFQKIVENIGPIGTGAIGAAGAALFRVGPSSPMKIATFAGLGAAIGYLARSNLGFLGKDPMLVAVISFLSTMYVPMPGGS